MSKSVSIVRGAVAAAAASLFAAGAVAAAMPPTPVVMKEIQGKSFDLGAKHAMVYFLAREGDCRTTFVVSDRTAPLAAPPHSPTRFEVEIAPGKSFELVGIGKQALQFECAPAGTALYVRPVEVVAYATN